MISKINKIRLSSTFCFFQSCFFFQDENKFNNINIIQKRVRNKNNMTTLSRQYKLSKNILFYILQRHGSESGKMAANLRRGSESGGGGSCFRIWQAHKSSFCFRTFFCYHAKYWDFSQLLPKQGDQVPRLLRPCVGIFIWIILLFVLYVPDFVIRLPPNFSSYFSWQQYNKQ